MSQNDNRCMDSIEFFEKTMTEKYDSTAFGVLVEHYSYESESFSYHLAILMLRGLNKCNYDEARPYLEAITYFLNIRDSLQMKRVEWILGYPQPVIQNTKAGVASFGMYGNSAIDDVVINYESTLNSENCVSILQIIIHNRRRLENLCLVCLRQLLVICDLNPAIFEFVASLPPPSYNYSNFTDWAKPFITNYIEDAKRYYYGGFQKEETGKETLKLFTLFEERLANKMQANQDIISNFRTGKKEKPAATNVSEKPKAENEESKEKGPETPAILRSALPVYVIGETSNEERIKEVQLLENEPGLVILENQVHVYIKESQPTGLSNLAFPPAVLKESYISSQQVRPGSALSHFIQPLHSGRDNQSDTTKAQGNYLF